MVLVIGASAHACIPDRPARLLDRGSVECVEEVAARLRALGADPNAGVVSARPGGFEIDYAATGDHPPVTVWAEGNRAVVVQRTADGWTRWTFDDTCRVRPPVTVPAAVVTEGLRFTDADLRRTRSEAGEAGVVVYGWSPHMPLSGDGYVEVAAAARRLGLHVEPVLIVPADTTFARQEALRLGLPEAALRQVAATELIERELLVHAPALIAFTEGRVSPVLPGYRNAAGYARFLERFLADR